MAELVPEPVPPHLGVIFTPSRPPEQLIPFVQAAESAGLDEVLLFEDCFGASALVSAVAALAATTRIRVGVGIVPMPLRNVALLAMEAATIDRLFPGRFRLGVGHGVQEWMGQAGARVASPLGLMREFVPALRALLAGDEVTVDGRYVRLDQVRLSWPPVARLSVHAAGEGPRTLDLTGEVADGTLLTTGSSPAAVADAVARVSSARAAAGRSGPHPVTVFAMTAFGPDASSALAEELAEWGYQGPPWGAAGSASDVADAMRELVAAGATEVLLQPLDRADLGEFVRDAGEVAALLRG
jgi:alkanesulfonate monooxygenase SsuD/methylene tetrahydromethanopterin reductase-like flavin-dependent oxidoreductase (luciferase family)